MAEKLTSVHCKYCSKELTISPDCYSKEKGTVCPACKKARIGWYILFFFVYSFLYSALTVLLSYNEMPLGTIPTMILFGLVLWLIRKSAEAMTHKRYDRELKKYLKSQTRSAETTPHKQPKVALAKYCKKCGGKIDDETRKCTSCGKQYFKIPNFTPKYCKVCGNPVNKSTAKCTKCHKQYFKLPKFHWNEKATLMLVIITVLTLCVFLYYMQPVYVLYQGSATYHKEGCPSASKKITLLEATVEGLTPCTRCH